MKPFLTLYRSVLLGVLGPLATGLNVGCMGRISVMGRDAMESEYRESYDAYIDREKKGTEPINAHDEQGRIPSWVQRLV